MLPQLSFSRIMSRNAEDMHWTSWRMPCSVLRETSRRTIVRCPWLCGTGSSTGSQLRFIYMEYVGRIPSRVVRKQLRFDSFQDDEGCLVVDRSVRRCSSASSLTLDPFRMLENSASLLQDSAA